MRFKTGVGAIAMALASASVIAFAEDSPESPPVNDAVEELSLSDLMNITVTTASRSEESIDDAPNVMYVVTQEQIKHRGYKSLKDIFQLIPGFGVDQKDIQYVGQVRGIAPNDNEKFAVMINGHMINQVTEPDFFQGGGFPLDNLERIEVIVGPGGVFYGDETLCAILNLITKKTDFNEAIASIGGWSSRDGGFGNGMGSSVPNRDMQVMFGQKSGDASFFGSGSYYERGGFDAWRSNSANSSNAALSKLDNVTGRVLPSYTMFLGADFKNWSGQFFSLNSEMPDLHLMSDGVTDGRRTDYVYSGVVRNKHEWSGGFSSSFEATGDLKRTVRAVVVAASPSQSDNDWDLSQTSYTGEIAIQHTVVGKNFFQIGLQAAQKQNRHNYDFHWNPENPYNFYSYTYDAQGNKVDSTRLGDMREIVAHSETSSGGLYVSDKFTINKYAKVVAAMRLDRDEILDSTQTDFFDLDKIYWSPRVALLLAPLDQLHFKLMYNRATRLAQTPQGTSLNHLWGIAEKGLAPSWATENPNITKPEALSTYEAQVIYYMLASRITLNYWHQRLNDYTSWFSPRTNVGDFDGDGFEYDVTASVNKNLTVWTNGAYSTNKFTITANSNKSGTGAEAGSAFQLPANDKGEVMGVPKFSANLGLDIHLLGNLYINPSLRYFTQQVSDAPVMAPAITAAGLDTTIVQHNFTYADNMVYLDLTVTYEGLQIPGIGHMFDLRASGRNLSDNSDLVGTQWMQDSYHPQGRTWEVAVSTKF